MDALTFIATMAQAVAWPIVALILVYVFRRDIGPLIGSLKKFTWGGKTLEFDRRLEAAEAEAKSLPPPPDQPALLPAPEEDAIIETAEISPRAAIVEAWLPVERQLYALGAKHGYGSGRARSVSFLLNRLANDGTIDSPTHKLINQLREMRNIVLHNERDITLSLEDVRRYHELAETVVEALRTG